MFVSRTSIHIRHVGRVGRTNVFEIVISLVPLGACYDDRGGTFWPFFFSE